MLRRTAACLFLGVLAGCSGGVGRSFAVHFQPYSLGLDPESAATVQAAVAFAKANPIMPVTLDGYHSQPDPGEHGTVQQHRVAVVKSALIEAGVGRGRIEVLGTGINYAQGTAMPTLPDATVMIHIGL